LPYAKKGQRSKLKTPFIMSTYNTTVAPAQIAERMLSEALLALEEQTDLLDHLSIEQFKANEILYYQAKQRNQFAKHMLNQASIRIKQIASF
jgi:hypothetical protein